MRLHTDPSVLTSGLFSIEGDPDAPTFRGVHDERRRWNGWAQPLFTRVIADTALRAHGSNDGASGLSHSWDGDVLVVTQDFYVGDPADVQRVEPVAVDGVALYDLGLGWVWDTVWVSR